jgi:hypothetical protein
MVRALAAQTDLVTAAGFASANLTVGTGSGMRRAHTSPAPSTKRSA